MKNLIFSFLMLFIFQTNTAQDTTFTEQSLIIDKFTEGTLLLPENVENPPLIIFIQGSGPTNRDGNQPMVKNDGIKKIAHELGQNGIASYRYDKRLFKMEKFGLREEDLTFDDFVEDVKTIVRHFEAQNSYRKILIAGHSEGSLMGILAAQEEKVDAFISLAGPGKPIDKIISDQIAKQSEDLAENARNAFKELAANGETKNYSPYLESIFRPSVQPYINSWMKYNPETEIAKLEIPVLIVNGSFDLQVDEADAEILHQAAPNSQLIILDKMNHIFRRIEGESLENSKAYNEPFRELHSGLIPGLLSFINSIDQ